MVLATALLHCCQAIKALVSFFQLCRLWHIEHIFCSCCYLFFVCVFGWQVKWTEHAWLCKLPAKQKTCMFGLICERQHLFLIAVQIKIFCKVWCGGATLRRLILAAWRSLLRVSVWRTNWTRSLAFNSTPSWTCSHAYIMSFPFISSHFIPYSLGCGASCN